MKEQETIQRYMASLKKFPDNHFDLDLLLNIKTVAEEFTEILKKDLITHYLTIFAT